MASTQEWHYSRNGNQVGPVAAADLKRLASTGQLSPSDLIWKEGWEDWKPAGAIKGLFVDAPPSKPVPPPLPETTHATASRTSGNVSDAVKSDLSDLMTTAKKAKDYAVAQTQKTRITQITLPKAYLALGKKLFDEGRFKEEFADLFQRISVINAEIDKVMSGANERPQATDLKGKLQSGAASLLAQGQAAKLSLQRDSQLRVLGKRAFELHGSEAGTPDVVSPITEALDELQKIDARIAESSSGEKVPLWQRMPVAALLTLCCFPVGLYLLWHSPRISRRTKLIWGGGFSAVLLFAIIMGQMTAAKAREDLAAAHQHWSSGDQQAAISKYRTLVNDSLSIIPESDRSLVLGRVIDFDAESGNTSSVETLLKLADEKHVVPSVSSEKARTLLSQRITQQQSQAKRDSSDDSKRPLGNKSTEAVTADFYPFTPGSKRFFTKVLYLGDVKIQSRHEVDHERGGNVRNRCVEKFMIPTTQDYLPNDDTVVTRYRMQGGFVEIGSQFENGPWSYERELKIGAKVGDSWKSPVNPTSTFSVVSFEDKEVEGKSVRSAVIEMTICDSNEKLICKVRRVYGRGIGPIETHSEVLNNGTMETSWTERLARKPIE